MFRIQKKWANKTYQGITYDWCVNHQCWCMHTTQECNLKLVEDKSTISDSASNTTKRRDEAMQAVIEIVDAESDDESESGSDEDST